MLRGLVFAVVLVVELLLLLPPKGVLGKCSILSIRWKLADRPVASGPALMGHNFSAGFGPNQPMGEGNRDGGR